MAWTDERVWVAALRAIAAVTGSWFPTNVATGPTVVVVFRAAPGMIDARLSISRGPGWG